MSIFSFRFQILKLTMAKLTDIIVAFKKRIHKVIIELREKERNPK
jgi:hypothetical protein